MNRTSTHLIPYFYLCFLLFYVGTRLSANTVTPNIHFTTINKENGLSSNYVNKVIKDKQGFLWIATNDGLCRYEAFNRIKIYKSTSDTINGLQSNNIQTIYADRKENLWIGTRQGGLTRFHQPTNTWKTFKHQANDKSSISNNEILSILEDSEGRIWVGTEDGLNLFQADTETFLSFKVDHSQPYALQSKAVLSIFEDDKGWIWIGTWAGGLHLLLFDGDGNMANSRFRRFHPKEDKGTHNIWSIYQDRQKQYWLSTHGGGLVKMLLPSTASTSLNHQNWTPQFHQYVHQEDNPSSISHNNTKSTYQDEKGVIWVATAYGLNYIDEVKGAPDNIHFHRFLFEDNNPNSIIGNVINNLYQDEQGLLWCSTNRGISIYNQFTNQFNVYRYSKEIEKNTLTKNLHIDQNGLGWLYTSNKGLINYNFKTEKHTIVKDKNGQTLFANKKGNYVGSTDQDELYISTSSGVNIIDKHQLTTKYYPLPASIEAKGGLNKVRIIRKDRITGKIWIGTESGLLSLEEQSGTYQLYQHDLLDATSISDNSINDILEDNRGFLWISTYNGLNRIDLKQAKDKLVFEQFHSNATDPMYRTPSNRFTVLEEIENTLYIGTTDGLYSYDYNSKQFTNHSALDNKFWIEGLEKNPDGHIWGSTSESLFHFNTETKAFNVYEKKDGLGDVNFKKDCSYVDKEGTLYFGSGEGVTSLHPNQILSNQLAPKVAITDIKTMSTKEELLLDGIYQNQIELDYNVYYLSINFSALNFNRPEKNQYTYRLEGFEERWNHTTSNSTATYTNLDPGTYIFHVKAANNDGVWNEEGKRLTIIKSPAFWQTTWFKILNVLGLFLVVGTGFSLYTRNINNRNRTLKTYNENLNQEIQERKRIEAALQEKETFTRLIMDNIPQHICWIDKEHRLIGANNTFLKFLEAKKEASLIGQPIDQYYISTNGKPEFEEIVNQVIKSGQPIYGKIGKYTAKDKAVSHCWLKQHFIPLEDENNNTIGVLTASTDITEQVKTDNQLQEYTKNILRSNQELEQFAYIASHDLQSPLTTIINFSKLLKRSMADKVNEREQEFLRFIISSTENMQELINAILEFSRVNNRKSDIKTINPTRLIEVLQMELDTILKKKNATIKVKAFPETIQGDKIILKQLLQNLITNGVKFSRKGVDPVITISCAEKAEYWEFQVKDNGIGISKEFNTKIFQLFQRLHAASKYEGTGIGLALCKKLVEKQDGEIWIESTPNKGSTFFFTIKKHAKLEANLQDGQPTNSKLKRRFTKKERVLLS